MSPDSHQSYCHICGEPCGGDLCPDHDVGLGLFAALKALWYARWHIALIALVLAVLLVCECVHPYGG